jgi:acyl dehydratase
MEDTSRTEGAPRGLTLDELQVGMTAEIERTVTEEQVRQFAEASSDWNPVHMDEDYARTTAFRGRIAHGLLPASFVSAVVGTKLPGPGSLYLGQTLSFSKPTRIGDVVTARVTVRSIDAASARVTLHTVALVNGEVALEGEALVRVPRRAPRASRGQPAPQA